MTRQLGLGAEIKSVFQSSTGAAHATILIKDGTQYSGVSTEVLPISGTSWFSSAFTPTETGVYVLIIDNVFIGEFEVVTRDALSILRNLEDQAFGSWEWNKTTKIMTLYRQDGSILGLYEADDSLESAYSRISISS